MILGIPEREIPRRPDLVIDVEALENCICAGAVMPGGGAHGAGVGAHQMNVNQGGVHGHARTLPSLLALFERSLEVRKRVCHPSVARVFETFQDARYIYIVLEYLTGGELLDRLVVG